MIKIKHYIDIKGNKYLQFVWPVNPIVSSRSKRFKPALSLCYRFILT